MHLFSSLWPPKIDVGASYIVHSQKKIFILEGSKIDNKGSINRRGRGMRIKKLTLNGLKWWDHRH